MNRQLLTVAVLLLNVAVSSGTAHYPSVDSLAPASLDVATLILQLDAPDPIVRVKAARALQWPTTPSRDARDALPALTLALEVEDVVVFFPDFGVEYLTTGSEAAMALADLSDTAIPFLRLVLEQPEPSYGQRQAIRALGAIVDADRNDWHASAGAVLRLVMNDLRRDESLRVGAALELGARGERDAVPMLIRGLRRMDVDGSRTMRLLAQLGDRLAVQPLIAVLANGDAITRQLAAEALGKIGDPVSIYALRATLTSDLWWPTRVEDAVALGRLGDRAYPELLQALHDVNDVQGAAASALGRIGDPAAAAALGDALTRDNGWVAAEALVNLGEFGYTTLVDKLRAPDVEVRQTAAGAFKWMQKTRPLATIAALSPVVASNDDPRVRARAILSLPPGVPDELLPRLTAALSDRDKQVRSAATRWFRTREEYLRQQLREERRR